MYHIVTYRRIFPTYISLQRRDTGSQQYRAPYGKYTSYHRQRYASIPLPAPKPVL